MGLIKNAAEVFGIEEYTAIPDDPLQLYEEVKGEYPFSPFE